MSISIRKAVVKLSAAAAVVAGGAVGTGWATSPVTGAFVTESADASMKTSVTIENKAVIEVIPNNPTDDALDYSVTDFSKINVNTFGNLGRIRVKTNSTAWDVVMTSDNGGRLKNSKYETGENVCQTNVFGEPYNCTWVSAGGAEYLTFASLTNAVAPDYATTSGVILGGADDGSGGAVKTPDTVLLRLAIGVAKSGKANGGGASATIYPMLDMTGAGTVESPIVLVNADILKTKKVVSGGYVYGTTVHEDLSFAEKIGGGYATTGTPPSGKFSLGIDGKSPTGRTWAVIGATGGFPAPQGNDVADEEYFYVNVGIDPTVKATKLGFGGNKEGPYEETFYFELHAKF